MVFFQITVTYVERCSHHKYLQWSNKAATSRTHWWRQLSRPMPNKTLQDDRICDSEKKRTHNWHSWNNRLLLDLQTPTHSWTETNQMWLKYYLNDESPWCVDEQDLQDILLIRVQFSAVCLHWYFIMYWFSLGCDIIYALEHKDTSVHSPKSVVNGNRFAAEVFLIWLWM